MFPPVSTFVGRAALYLTPVLILHAMQGPVPNHPLLADLPDSDGADPGGSTANGKTEDSIPRSQEQILPLLLCLVLLL